MTGEKLAKRGIQTVGDLRGLELPALEADFGSYGVRLYELSRGIDRSEVVPDRPTKSISVEDTFEHDVPLTETEQMIRHLAEKLWSASRKEPRIPRTVVLKLKTREFKILTRSHTSSAPPSSCEELTLEEFFDNFPEIAETVQQAAGDAFTKYGFSIMSLADAKSLLVQSGNAAKEKDRTPHFLNLLSDLCDYVKDSAAGPDAEEFLRFLKSLETTEGS